MTPLEQIKERLEALKVSHQWDEKDPDNRQKADLAYGRNRALDEVITLLPSIIQEVEGATRRQIAESLDWKKWGLSPTANDSDILDGFIARAAYLKEESK